MSSTITKVPGSQPIEWLSIDDLAYDPDIQRPTDERRAERIAAAFDPAKFGVIAVWHQVDDEHDRNVVLDGMHRVTALRLMGWNGQKIPCSVFEGISKPEAAELFIGRNDSTALKYIDKFLVRLVAQDPVAVAVNHIAVNAGYTIGRDHRNGVIVAARALENVYIGRGVRVKGHHPQALRMTLETTTNAWGRTTDAVNGRTITAVGALFLRYGDAIDYPRLSKKLAAVPGPDALAARGSGYRERHGGDIASNAAHYLVDAYNSGLRGKVRLAGWRETGYQQ